jgi:hypothetical protein
MKLRPVGTEFFRADRRVDGKTNVTKLIFHCFTVHFDSLRFIHTNSCTFSYNHALVF